MYIPPYNPREFRTTDTGFHNDGLWIRPGIIQAINPETGLLDIEWLDHPGIRQEVAITQPHQGMFQLPTVGAVVLIGFDQGFAAQILRYLPAGYQEQVKDRILYPISTGELMLVSFQDSKEVVKEKKFTVPNPTGTRFFMNNVGDIEMATALGESWRMDNANSEISQNSMNYTVTTEAGVLQFGLIKRLPEGEDTVQILTPDGTDITKLIPPAAPEGLTEFRLRVLEKADAQEIVLDPTAFIPEIGTPLVELTLGVKVDDNSNIIKTTDAQATTSGDAQEIIIQLKTKSDQGFEFTVDKEGNVTLISKGNMKVKIEKDSELIVEGNANINVTGDLTANAANIKLAGDSAVVLADFLAVYNSHTHGTSVGPTTIPAPQSTSIHKSKIGKVK